MSRARELVSSVKAEFDNLDGSAVAPAFSEEALALKFAACHKDDLRYVAAWGKWLRYTDGRWVFDDVRRVFSLAREICREAAAGTNKPGEAKAIASAKTRAAVISLASEDERLVATKDQWDADPWLLNTPAGVVDLQTGKLRDQRREDFMTKMTAVAPDESCPTPLWSAFLEKVTDRGKDLQSYLARMSGYSLTGLTYEHAMFFFHGLGSNGKSVYLHTVTMVQGDYHTTAPIEVFTEVDRNRHPTELAGLRGARCVTSIETEEGRRWAESRIKALTAGDPISARFMRQDFFTFVPQFKLMVAGNHKPSLRSIDEAMRRRMNLIPFVVTIKPEERDKKLEEKLKAEWPGILAWMINGCLEWQKTELSPPKVVKDATEDYLTEEDALTHWFDECCERDAQAWTGSSDLFGCWKNWAEAMCQHVGSDKHLVHKLEQRNYPRARDKDGRRGFLGLRLKATKYSPKAM